MSGQSPHGNGPISQTIQPVLMHTPISYRDHVHWTSWYTKHRRQLAEKGWHHQCSRLKWDSRCPHNRPSCSPKWSAQKGVMRGQINNSNNRQNSHKQVTYHIVLETSNSFDKDGTPLSKGFLVNSNLARATKSSHLRLISIFAQEEKSPTQMLWLGMREVSGVKERTPIMFQSNTTTTGSTPRKTINVWGTQSRSGPLDPAPWLLLQGPWPAPQTQEYHQSGLPSEQWKSWSIAYRFVCFVVVSLCYWRGGVWTVKTGIEAIGLPRTICTEFYKNMQNPCRGVNASKSGECSQQPLYDTLFLEMGKQQYL